MLPYLRVATTANPSAIATSTSISCTASPAQRQLVARTLALRLFAGWCAYVLEINSRTGVRIPQLGEPTLSSPEYTLT